MTSGVGSGGRRGAKETTFVGSADGSVGAGSCEGAAGSPGGSAGLRPIAAVSIV